MGCQFTRVDFGGWKQGMNDAQRFWMKAVLAVVVSLRRYISISGHDEYLSDT